MNFHSGKIHGSERIGRVLYWVTYMTILGMVTTQRLELLANGTHALLFPLADLRVLQHALHLVAGRQLTVGVAAVERMGQRLDAAQDGVFVSVLVSNLLLVGRGRTIVQVQTQLVHLVLVAVLLVTGNTQVEVLARGESVDIRIIRDKSQT